MEFFEMLLGSIFVLSSTVWIELDDIFNWCKLMCRSHNWGHWRGRGVHSWSRRWGWGIGRFGRWGWHHWYGFGHYWSYAGIFLGPSVLRSLIIYLPTYMEVFLSSLDTNYLKGKVSHT